MEERASLPRSLNAYKRLLKDFIPTVSAAKRRNLLVAGGVCANVQET
jgi:hypothetical protein